MLIICKIYTKMYNNTIVYNGIKHYCKYKYFINVLKILLQNINIKLLLILRLI